MILNIILIATAAIVIIFIALFKLLFGPGFTNIFSPMASVQVKSKSIKGVSFLIQNGLGYHSHFTFSSRKRFELNKWTFAKSGIHSEEKISLPYCYNGIESSDPGFEGPVNYETTLLITDEMLKHIDNKGHYHLVFNGSFFETAVYIDGRLVGGNKGGYLPFRFDISPYIQDAGRLRLTVAVDGSIKKETLPPLLYTGHPLGFHPYGGIHKAVYIEEIPAAYIFKCHVRASASGEVRVDAAVHNPHEIESGKLSLNCKFGRNIVAQTESVFTDEKDYGVLTWKFRVENPELWSPELPRLYELQLKSTDETLSVEFGFSVPAVKNGRITHNGEPVQLQGVCRHEEDRYLGLSQSRGQMEKDLSLVKSMGMNFARLAHYPHDPYFLELSDREGLFLWEEIPLYQGGLAPVKYIAGKSPLKRDKGVKRLLRSLAMIMKTGRLTSPGLRAIIHDDLLRMIERDYNHPSVIFWGIGNECWTFNGSGERLLRWMKKLAAERDPVRPAGYAAMTIPGITERFERSFKVMDFIGINEYHGWYYGNEKKLEQLLVKLHEKHPGKPILITETGCDAAPGAAGDPDVRAATENYQVTYLRKQMDVLERLPYVCGFSVWVLKDFLCPEYGQDNPVPFYNLKGLVDRDYNKKQGFNYMASYLKRSKQS